MTPPMTLAEAVKIVDGPESSIRASYNAAMNIILTHARAVVEAETEEPDIIKAIRREVDDEQEEFRAHDVHDLLNFIDHHLYPRLLVAEREREEAREELAEIFAAREKLTNETHDEATREVLSRFNFEPFIREERTVLMAKEIVALQSRAKNALAALERVRNVTRYNVKADVSAFPMTFQQMTPHPIGHVMRAESVLTAAQIPQEEPADGRLRG